VLRTLLKDLEGRCAAVSVILIDGLNLVRYFPFLKLPDDIGGVESVEYDDQVRNLFLLFLFLLFLFLSVLISSTYEDLDVICT